MRGTLANVQVFHRYEALNGAVKRLKIYQGTVSADLADWVVANSQRNEFSLTGDDGVAHYVKFHTGAENPGMAGVFAQFASNEP